MTTKNGRQAKRWSGVKRGGGKHGAVYSCMNDAAWLTPIF